jgi:divalent metal cation (Fe/Co/Zn/Cd) transporter
MGSQSLIADSKETLACVVLSVALLIGLGVHYMWRLWWIDPATALVIALLVFREGVETFRESQE